MRFKNLYLLFCLFSASYASAQLNSSPINIIDDLNIPNMEFRNSQQFGKTGSCGVDTVYYPYYKSTAFYAVALNNVTSGNAFSQYYPSPQAITVSGFDFFAYQSAGTDSVITITCNLYLATSDSLPLGNPARTKTIQIDSSFGGGLLSVLRKHIDFGTPITLSSPYIITLETSSSTSVSVICNNYVSGNGRAEYLSGVRLGNSWRRGYQINVGSYPFNADFILMPNVSYELTADFSFFGCNNGNTSFTFTNTSSPILQHAFYNRYAYYGIPQLGSQWTYGDNTGSTYSINGQHTYTSRQPFTVTLRDTFYGWTVGCVDYANKLVPYRPLPPGVSNDGPHCSGDSLMLSADSVQNLTYSWTGPKNFSSTSQNLKFLQADTSINGRYYLRVAFQNCTSTDTFTDVLIRQTPEKPLATNDGPKCVGDSVSFSANSNSPNIMYRWTGPNGFIDSSDGFVFYSLDTNDVGTYYVHVEDPHCVSKIDSTILYTYPPPQVPMLSSLVGDSICSGDTIYFDGVSVTGAVFDWQGPSSFQSAIASPSFLADDTLQSGWYSSRVIIGSCVSDKDSIYIDILQSPTTSSIQGSDTSTEFYTKTYSSSRTSNDTLIWTCTGGNITSYNHSTGEITVEWGAKGQGSLTVYSLNKNGCIGETESYTISILVTPPPIDPSSIWYGKSENLKIYPNPSNGKLNLAYPNELELYSYELRNIQGQRIEEANCQNCKNIQLKEHATGTYYLILNSNRGPLMMVIRLNN